jgi:hypothetical protein
MDVKHGIVAAMLLLAPATAIADCTARSPDHSVALLELYTSEGCDSCPPADRWLSRFNPAKESNRVVPLALHVDYWDRLGWKDRFASPIFTDRQREQMRRQHSSFVYTPQVLLQGRDFPQWHSGGDPSRAIATINSKPARATIELGAETSRSDVKVDLRVRVPDPRDRQHAVVAVVLVQSGLVSDVKTGENAGKRLAHDHVVRQWRAGPSLDANGEAVAQLTLTLPADPGPLTIVAFAENSATGEVLQALALPFCARS